MLLRGRRLRKGLIGAGRVLGSSSWPPDGGQGLSVMCACLLPCAWALVSCTGPGMRASWNPAGRIQAAVCGKNKQWFCIAQSITPHSFFGEGRAATDTVRSTRRIKGFAHGDHRRFAILPAAVLIEEGTKAALGYAVVKIAFMVLLLV